MAEYSCDADYEICPTCDKQRFCQNNATWNGTEPHCQSEIYYKHFMLTFSFISSHFFNINLYSKHTRLAPLNIRQHLSAYTGPFLDIFHAIYTFMHIMYLFIYYVHYLPSGHNLKVGGIAKLGWTKI